MPDNARIHHAKLVQPLLDEVNERLELMFLHPYNSELNLIEGDGDSLNHL
ncbi:transposase [Clostridium botulinum]